MELQISTIDQSIDNIGVLLPNIKELKLSNSYISSLRDLGTKLHNLEVLWVDKCELKDLDGVLSLPS